MREELKTLQPFRHLEDPALATVERHSRLLRLPAGRWLMRGGQQLTREMFLVDGVVAGRRGRVVEHLDAKTLAGAALNAWAVGVRELSTRTAAEIISVDPRPLRHLQADLPAETGSPLPAVAHLDDWMHALLQGPVLRWFSPGAWARVLRAGRLRDVARGERVVALGEVCTEVFVVARGVAQADDQRFAAGDFFGAESALGRCPAEREVRMRTDGALVCFARADVVELAADYAPPRVEPPPHRLDLDAVPAGCEEQTLAALPRQPAIAVRGTDPARRLMVATRLMRRGFHVV